MVYHHLFIINYWRYWTNLQRLPIVLMKLLIKILKKKGNWQFIRCWNKLEDKFSSCYLSLSLMGNVTCEDILEKVLEASNGMKFSDLLQLLMDDPNVNWAVLECLVWNQNEEHLATMLFHGSYGLYVLNGVLQTGHKAAQWKIKIPLRSFYKLLKDSLPQHFDFISFNECQQLPTSFALSYG